MGERPTMALVCSGCGVRITAAGEAHYRCPNAGVVPGVDHVLRQQGEWLPAPLGDDVNPFVMFRHRLYAYARALACGMSDEAYVAMVQGLDAAVEAVDGRAFRVTPLTEARECGAALGFAAPGALWIKDETDNVAGSHKARHLFGIMLHLSILAVQQDRPLAIASCGNAALAAAVVARAAQRPLVVHIPPDANPRVVQRLQALGASLVVCQREGEQAGDPCYLRFRDAVAAGAVPFSCQGSDNGLTIEGGMTLGYEIVAQQQALGLRFDHLVVQVGGAALASALAGSLSQAVATGVIEGLPRFHVIQTVGAFPLIRAYDRLAEFIWARLHGDEVGCWEPGRDHLLPAERLARHNPETLAQTMRRAAAIQQAWSSTPVQASLRVAAQRRALFMWPWESQPHSLAHGILDDETYDWFAVVSLMLRSGGIGVVASEAMVAEAQTLARATTSVPADHTGTASLAGLMALRQAEVVQPTEKALVFFTGVDRDVEAVQRAAQSVL